MELGRAVKFGLLGSLGFTLVWTVAFFMIREVQRGVRGGTTRGDITILIILLGVTVVSVIVLFVLIGEYVDQELEARGLSNPEESEADS